MDNILNNYQYYFIIASYAVFLAFFGGMIIHSYIKYRHIRKLNQEITDDR